MKKKKEMRKPTQSEVDQAMNILLADFIASDKMQNLSDTHGDRHVVEVRVVAYKEGQEDSPCLEERLQGYVVQAQPKEIANVAHE